MFLNPQHLSISVTQGSGEEACEVGNRVESDNPCSRAHAQRSRIRGLQEPGLESSWLFQVALGRSFHCTEAHAVLISVCIERAGQR